MKKFIYVMVKDRPRNVGGRIQTVWVYSISKNEATYVTETTWNTASYPGATTCVQKALADIGVIPKQYKQGYYEHGNPHFSLTRVGG